jgi:hypothetical protein
MKTKNVAAALFLAASCEFAMASPPDQPCSSSGNPMTQFPVLELSNISSLHPMGNVDGASHVLPTPHTYIYLKPDPSKTVQALNPGQSMATDIISPGDVRVAKIEQHQEGNPNGTSTTSYKITLQVCDTGYLYIDHINSLDPTISALLSTYPSVPGNTIWYSTSGLELTQAGLPIGTSISTHALDLGAFDFKFTASFASPQLYLPNYPLLESQYNVTLPAAQLLNPSKSYFECPLNFFNGSVQLQWYQYVLGGTCGEFAQDRDTASPTALGSWLPSAWYNNLPVTGAYSNEGTALGLAHDTITPTVNVFSLGTGIPVTDPTGTTLDSTMSWVEGGDFTFSVENNQTDWTNWDFANNTKSWGVVCYHALQFYGNGGDPADDIGNLIFLVQMVDDNINGNTTTYLRIQARHTGTCPVTSARNLNNNDSSGNPLTANFFRTLSPQLKLKTGRHLGGRGGRL